MLVRAARHPDRAGSWSSRSNRLPLAAIPLSGDRDKVRGRCHRDPQIKRFAHAVFAGAIELDAGGDKTLQRISQSSARRIKNGEMKETGRAGRRRRAAETLPRVQADVVVVAAGGNERRLRSHALHQFKPKNAAVKRERAFQVRYLEMDMADRYPRVDGTDSLG